MTHGGAGSDALGLLNPGSGKDEQSDEYDEDCEAPDGAEEEAAWSRAFGVGLCGEPGHRDRKRIGDEKPEW